MTIEVLHYWFEEKGSLGGMPIISGFTIGGMPIVTGSGVGPYPFNGSTQDTIGFGPFPGNSGLSTIGPWKAI